jgi:zinc D-Ala-D-Ala carboxypeptidase
MKLQSVLLPAILGLLVYGLTIYFAIGRTSAYAQVANGDRPRIARTAITTPRTSESAANAARFSAAASQNAKLRNSLTWNFGKTQTGWEIYVPLISNTIGTDASPESPDFAAALSKWQLKNSLEPSGVLDSDTLGALIGSWQSQRLGRSNFPGDDHLLSAPIVDFYDPTRSPDLLQLERETYTAYRKMIAAASQELGDSVRFTRTGQLAEGEKFLRIVSAYRSPEYQAQLRQQSPGSGRAALAKNSAHSTGQALDLYVGGEPVTTKDTNRLVQVHTPAYKWLVKNAARFGFYPYFYEPWHWEYVGIVKK